MSMVKCNVVEAKRTPAPEIKRADADWDKEAAAEFTAKDVKEPGHGPTESDKHR